MMAAGKGVKRAMGGVLAVMGVPILTGFDKAIEAWIVQSSPDWLTTRF